MAAVYSLLLNFGMSEYYHFLVSVQEYYGEDHGCGPGYFYDPFYLSCRQMYCGGGPDDGQHCSDMNEKPDWGSQYVVEMDSIQLILYAKAVYSNESISHQLVDIVQQQFVPAFADFMGISQVSS